MNGVDDATEEVRSEPVTEAANEVLSIFAPPDKKKNKKKKKWSLW